ncbi:MAG: hypothetical protein ACREM1_06445 [Longimicrobiales bacterium]
MDASEIRRLLRRRKIATMPELKEAVGTEVDVTVFRKLRELAYRTSYSHGGRYYTLDEIARFDVLGLWSFRSVWFSQHGTLIRTCEALVGESEAGYFTEELEATLHVGVKDVLRKLAQEDRIVREKVSGRFLHTSADRTVRRAQLRARQVRLAHPGEIVSFGAGTRVIPDELKAAIVLFFALLDEKQRRLYAGLESLKLGHGGDQRIAELLGLDPGTVARGRRELLAQDVETERVRHTGAGRPSAEKKRRK